MCNLFTLPSMKSGLCGLKSYDEILKEGTKQTAEQIKQTLLKKKAFNNGERCRETER